MAAAPASALPVLSAFDNLICRSTVALSRRLRRSARVASLDLTQKHLSIAISDRERGQAMPFGIFCRTSSPAIDAKMISSALRHAATLDESKSLHVDALVVGVAPDSQIAIDYTYEFMRNQLSLAAEGSSSDECPFPDLTALLFYSEAHSLHTSLRNQADYIRSLESLPEKLDFGRLKRFAAAMNPRIAPAELIRDRPSRARLECTDVLQAVLEDLKRHSST